MLREVFRPALIFARTRMVANANHGRRIGQNRGRRQRLPPAPSHEWDGLFATGRAAPTPPWRTAWAGQACTPGITSAAMRATMPCG